MNDFRESNLYSRKRGYMRNVQEENADKAEDRVWKASAYAFGEEMHNSLGQSGTIKRIAPTEQILLNVRQLQEDFNFEMEEGYWRHYEFESDPITVADMRRFREYEANLSMQFQVPVITTVVCTAAAGKRRNSLEEGINTYRVEWVQMKDRDADQVLQEIQEKVDQGEIITKADLVPIVWTPLMSGKTTIYERIIRGMQLLKQVAESLDKEDVKKLQAILYTFAVKFLKKDELDKVKGEMSMSYLGQMIFEDGVAEGIAQGSMQMLVALVKDGFLKAEEAAKRLNISEADFEQRMKEE